MRPSIIKNDKKYYILDPLDRFQLGQGRRYEINGVDVAAFLLNGKVIAIAGRCPHAGSSMAQAMITEKYITCPRHSWKFSTEDGSAGTEATCDIDYFETIIHDDAAWINVSKK